MEYVRIHSFVGKTAALGPGKRAAVWFQGCRRKCKGCMTPESRSLNGGVVTSVETLTEQILSINGIEGVTISGGEPFLQEKALCELLTEIKRKTDLSIIIYTGYTLNQLIDADSPYIDKIIYSLTDVLIDGEYIDKLNDGIGLRGSSNQQIHYLSDRYRDKSEMFECAKRDCELLSTEKYTLLIGVPDKQTLSECRRIIVQKEELINGV